MSCLSLIGWFLLSVLPLPLGAIDIVYLKSGSTLVTDFNKEVGPRVEVTLLSGARVSIESRDIDKIMHETTPPIQLTSIDVDPEKLLPDTTDPLDWWLDVQQPVDPESARLFLTFKEQIARGEKLPLARSIADVNLARKQKIKTIEFADLVLHLGMDMQYHDNPGPNYEDAFQKLQTLEHAASVKQVVDFIGALRGSALDVRKEQVIAAAIELRDRLDPDYGLRIMEMDNNEAAVAEPGPIGFFPPPSEPFNQ